MQWEYQRRSVCAHHGELKSKAYSNKDGVMLRVIKWRDSGTEQFTTNTEACGNSLFSIVHQMEMEVGKSLFPFFIISSVEPQKHIESCRCALMLANRFFFLLLLAFMQK